MVIIRLRRILRAFVTRKRSAQDRVRRIEDTHYCFDAELTRKMSRPRFQQILENEKDLLDRFGLGLLPLQSVSIDIRFIPKGGRHFEAGRLSFRDKGEVRLIVERSAVLFTDWGALTQALAALFEKTK